MEDFETAKKSLKWLCEHLKEVEDVKTNIEETPDSLVCRILAEDGKGAFGIERKLSEEKGIDFEIKFWVKGFEKQE